MRSLFFLTMGAIMLLGIDAAEFNSHHCKAAWQELSRQGRMLQYKAERGAVTLRPRLQLMQSGAC